MPRANKSFYDPYTSAGETGETETAYYYVESLPGGTSDTTYNGKNYYLHHSDTSGGSGFNVTSDDQYEITGFTFAGGTAIGDDYDGAKFYYTRNSYNIIYINNGVQDKVVSKLYEESIADAGSYEPARPSTLPDTFTFGGWYADPTVKQAYDFTGKTMPAQNITVYAKWTEPTSIATAFTTIIGGSSETIDPIPYGGTITEQLNALQETIMKDKTGYTWRGWRTGPNGTGEPFNVDTKIYSNITLYPYYTKDGTFTVKYVSGKNDVTAPVDGKSYAEDSFADLKSPGKLVADDGKYFLGWSDGAATYQPRDKYQIKSNHANEQNVITLTAQWGARPAGTTLTYKANGGAGEDVVENLDNNATVTTKPADTFSRVGYTFKGWNTAADGSGISFAPNTQVQVDNNDGANVLYAIWSANTDTKYTVEFYYQNTDGSYPQTASVKDETRTATTDTTVSVKPEDKNDRENGKYVYDKSAPNVESGNVAGDGSLVLKLYFKLNQVQYTIRHRLNDDVNKIVAPDEIKDGVIGRTVTAGSAPVETRNPGYKNAGVVNYVPKQTITLDADASKNIITVLYENPVLTVTGYKGKYDGQEHSISVEISGSTKELFTFKYSEDGTEWFTNLPEPEKNVCNKTIKIRATREGFGTLEGSASIIITPRPVTLTSGGGEKVYDGTALTNGTVTVSGDGFADGEGATWNVTGSQTVVGESGNTFTYELNNGTLESNYTITKHEGELKVTPVTDEVVVTITGNTKEETYDGTEKSVTDYKVKGISNTLYTENDFSLKTGVEAKASGTDAGTYKMGLTADSFENISANFTNVRFVVTDGELVIKKRDVTFTGESKTLTYTGSEQSITGITATGLLDGHKYEDLTYEAKGTNVGSYGGVFSGNVVIKNAAGKVVTENYNVEKEPGKLTITNASFAVTFTGESDTKVYNGKEQSITGITPTGLLEGHTYSGLTYAAKGTDAGEYEGAFSGTVKIVDAQSADVTQNYAITQTPGKLTITAVETEVVVTITGGTDTVTYDGNEHSVNGYEIDSIQIDGKDSTLYTVNDFEFTGTATATGTNADKYEMGLKESDFRNISDNFTNVKFIVNDGWLVISKRLVKVTAERLEYAYDYKSPVVHPEDGVVRYTVEAAEGDRGLLAGDALNADVLYDGQSTQTLIGVYAAVAQIGSATITNDNGVVTPNYAIEKVDSTLTIKGNDPIDPGKETTSVQTNYTVGDVIEYKITVKNVSKNEATGVVVTDTMAEIQDGANYTVSADRHTATLDPIPAGGTVVVEAKHTVTAEDVEKAVKETNGILTNVANINFNNKDTTVTGDPDKLNDTYGYVVRYLWNDRSTKIRDDVKGSAKVGDELTAGVEQIGGYTPVKGQAESQKLTIKPYKAGEENPNVITFYYYKNVELTAKSDSKVYNGSEQSVSGFTGAPADADFSAITVGAKGTDVGTYPANFADGTVGTVDANNKYIVTEANNGQLVITPITEKTITITAASGSKTYDGTPLTNNGFSYTEGVLVKGDVLTAVVEGSATNVGDEGKNVVKSYKVTRESDGKDVTKNYTFTDSVPGKLTINPIAIELTANSASKTYDGTALTDGGYSITKGAFVGEEGLESVTVVGSQTIVGSSANTITGHELKSNTLAQNYEITYKPGTLTVTDRDTKYVITVKAISTTATYDGKEHSAIGVETYEFTVNGQKYTVEGLTTDNPSKINADEYPNNISGTAVVRDAAGNNVTAQFTVNTENGKLTIKVRPITLTGDGWETAQSYTGNEYSTTDFDVEQANAANDRGLVSGETVEATYELKGTLVGSYTGVFDEKATIIKAGDKNVTANYEIAYVPRTLTITGDKIVPGKTTPNVDSNYALGAEIPFTITVKNVSTETVTEITVVDQNAVLKAGQGYTLTDAHTAVIASLESGGTVEISAVHIVTSNDILAGTVGNKATVTWPDGTKDVSADTKKLDKPIVTMNVVKTSDKQGKEVGLGETITYTITVTNTGNVPYTNVTFDDELEGVKVAISPIETLAVGETKTVTTKVTHKVTEADLLRGSITNKVTAKANEITYTYYEGNTATSGKATPKSNEAKVTDETTKAKVSTSSTKTTTSKPKNDEGYALGETITYDITVTNDGNQTVTNIEVVDTLEGAEIVKGDGYKIVNGVAVIDKLEPGQSVSVKAQYTVKEKDILAGKVLNSATVTGKGPGTDPEPGEPTTDDPTDEPKATLAIDKSVEGKPENGAVYKLGEKITYKLTVSVGANNNVTVKDIKVTDKLLTRANVDSGAVEIAGGYTLNEDNEIELPNMAPGADDVVITYTYKVQANDLGENGQYGTVHNAAKVEGATPEQDPENPNPKPDKPTGKDDEDTPTSIKLTITANDNTVKYDGKPHGGNGYTPTGVVDGHKITGVTISGSETAVGEYKNKLVPSDAKIEDAAGKDVTSHYEIDYVNGTLTITKGDINEYVTLTPVDVEEKYDGKTYTSGVARAEDKNGGALTIEYSADKGKTWTTDPSEIKAKDVAESKTIQVRVSSTNYDGYVTGTQKLTITKREVTLTSGSGEKAYDGTALTNSNVTVGGDKFVTGEGAVYNVTGSQTEVGESDNTFTYTLNEGTKEGNYTIVPAYGKLKVTLRPLTITINSVTKPYNGAMQDVRNPEAAAPFTNLEYTYTGLADTDTISYLDVVYGPDKNTDGQKYAGTYDAVIGEKNGKKSLQIVNKETKASALENYTLKVNDGELIITQAQIKVYVYGGDGETVYNGQRQELPKVTNIRYNVTIDTGIPPVITPVNDSYIVVNGLAGGDTLAQGTLRYLLAGTDANCTQPDKDHVIPGKEIEGKFIDPTGNAYSNNSTPYDADESRPTVLNGTEDVSANYVFTYYPGNFYIKPRPVTITAKNGNWTYDAQKHTESGVIAEPANGDTGLVSGHTAEATMTDDSWIIDAGTRANVIATKDGKPQVKITANGVDVTANYVIMTEEGTLKVFRRGDPEGPDKRLVTITAEDNDEVDYDGKMHGAKKNDKGEIVEDVSFTTSNFIESEGHTVKPGTVSITGEAKLVGTYEDLLVPGTEETVVILDKNNNNVTKNYFITFVPGNLTINGQEIDQPEKKYDETKAPFDLGDEIPFTITVKNVSKETVKDVRVTEQADAKIIDGDGYKVENGVALIASLAPEETVVVKAVHIVTVDDLEKFWNSGKKYENTAVVSWENGSRDVTKEVDDFADPTYTYDLTKEIEPSADHPDITKPYYKDEVVTFKITVKNTGNMRQTIELTEDSIGLNGVMPDLKETSVTVDPNSSKTVFATVKIDETILAVRNGDAFNRIWADNGKGKDDSRKYADATLPLPALHKLTIKYVLENGNPIPIDPASAWKYEIELRAGEKYSRLSPVLNNLETDTPLVEGVMPDHDLEITVIYTGNGGGGGDNPGGGGEEEPKKENERDTTIRIRDYETPLGLSNVFMNAGDCFE